MPIASYYAFLGYLQLTDFGMARKLKTKEDLVFTFCGTPEYLSPEMLMHKGQGSRVTLVLDCCRC